MLQISDHSQLQVGSNQWYLFSQVTSDIFDKRNFCAMM